ncbi:MAG TPA: SAM-dependent methyltransferase [Chitinophagaceae bacterium]|nr:SAM-dependent methyltransferase [Chitinophagaceae bacterium]
MAAVVYLIPTVLYEGEMAPLPAYIIPAVKECTVFFVENERTARRYLKTLWKEMVIDDKEWHSINKVTEETINNFKKCIAEEKTIGIISEAGCPGVADPGQQLIAVAQQLNVIVRPLVGPNSILLALMASGMNGQHFQFTGYLPIDIGERSKAVKNLEIESKQKGCTQIFIETPYRNNQLIETVLKTCQPATQFCIAVNLTGSNEWIKTASIKDWKGKTPDIHKQPAIFLLMANN